MVRSHSGEGKLGMLAPLGRSPRGHKVSSGNGTVGCVCSSSSVELLQVRGRSPEPPGSHLSMGSFWTTGKCGQTGSGHISWASDYSFHSHQKAFVMHSPEDQESNRRSAGDSRQAGQAGWQPALFSVSLGSEGG